MSMVGRLCLLPVNMLKWKGFDTMAYVSIDGASNASRAYRSYCSANRGIVHRHFFEEPYPY